MGLFNTMKHLAKKIFPVSAESAANQINAINSELKNLREELQKAQQIINRNEIYMQSIEKCVKQSELLIKGITWGSYQVSGYNASYAYSSCLPESQYPEALCKWYYQNTGHFLNLIDPKTFNEKIQWLKLYDSTPLKTQLADKYLSREWVGSRIGEEYLVPLLGVWDSFDEINFDYLPKQFVLKTTHGSGMNYFVTDKAAFDKDDARDKINRWMSMNYAFLNGFELHYMNVKPRIIAEQFISNKDGLIDYRFYCFNGHPAFLFVDKYSGTKNHIRSIFDMSWIPMNMRATWPDGGEQLAECPKSFDKMKELSAILSREFAFVRVDFFEVDEKLYVGEMTFTPMAGKCDFDPPEWDYTLGKMLILPPKSPMPKRQR